MSLKNVKINYMKKILLFSFLVLITAGFAIYFLISSGVAVEKKQSQPISEGATVNLPEVSTQSGQINYNNSEKPSISSSITGYKTVWISVNDNQKLFLFSNLENKLSSNELATKNNCEYLVSGGFYNQEGNPIGLFVTEGETFSQIIDSATFNGYFNVSDNGVASITRYPIFSPRISLQTGPILLENGSKVDLSLVNDDYARRIAVGVTENNLILFLVFYDQENNLSGPSLSELPGIIEQVNNDKKLLLKDVINLDGGNHSAFISNIIKLSETATIGSFFCIKP